MDERSKCDRRPNGPHRIHGIRAALRVGPLLIFRADIGVPWIPKHIFEGQEDVSTFTHYDSVE